MEQGICYQRPSSPDTSNEISSSADKGPANVRRSWRRRRTGHPGTRASTRRALSNQDVQNLHKTCTLLCRSWWRRKTGRPGTRASERSRWRCRNTIVVGNISQHPCIAVQIVAEAENRAPRDAGLGEKSVRRLSALSVAAAVENGSGRGGSVAPAPATEEQQQVGAAALHAPPLSSVYVLLPAKLHYIEPAGLRWPWRCL